MVQLPPPQFQPRQEAIDRLDGDLLPHLPTWEAQEWIALEHAVATAIHEHIATIPTVDEINLSTFGRDLAPTLVHVAIASLRPEWLSMPCKNAPELVSGTIFRDEQHQFYVGHQLADVIRYWAAGLVYGYDIGAEVKATAVLLVETALAEIGPVILDNAVAYAPQVAFVLRYLEAYLQQQAKSRLDFGEEGCLRIAVDCLSLIAQAVHRDFNTDDNPKAEE